MAAKYRKIDPRMWDDEKFEEMEPMHKLVAINALTSQSNRIGIFKFSPAKSAEQCGMSLDSYAIAIAKVSQTLKWGYDKARNVLFIPTWFKYNPPENPKHFNGCLGDLHDLPQTTLLNVFLSNVSHVPPHCLSVLEKLKDSYAIAMPNQKQEQEQKQDTSADKAAAGGASPKREPRNAKTNPDHKPFVEYFVNRWHGQYGAKYHFLGKDAAAASGVLRAAGNLERARTLVDFFLADTNRYVVDQKHPLSLLLNQINRFIPMLDGNGEPASSDGFVPVRPALSDLPWPQPKGAK